MHNTFLLVSIVDREGIDWSSVTDIHHVPPFQPLVPDPRIAGALGPDSPTTSNGDSYCIRLHAIPLPFIDDPEASLLPTSIDCFRLHNRTTKSMAARNKMLSSHDQGRKLDARCFSASSGLESCSVEPNDAKHTARQRRKHAFESVVKASQSPGRSEC